MTKKNVYTVIIHAVCWVLVALPVFIFAPEHARQTVVLDVLRLFFPLFLCAIFYLNYLWLVPKFFVEKQFAAYASINLVVILFISLHSEYTKNVLQFSVIVNIRLMYTIILTQVYEYRINIYFQQKGEKE